MKPQELERKPFECVGKKSIFYRSKRKIKGFRLQKLSYTSVLILCLSYHLKIVFLKSFVLNVLIFYRNQKTYVRHRRTQNHQSTKVITAAIFIPHILLPEIISGSYLCLYAYIFPWLHSNSAICVIFLRPARFYNRCVHTVFIPTLSDFYEVLSKLVDRGNIILTYWFKIQKKSALFVLWSSPKKFF